MHTFVYFCIHNRAPARHLFSYFKGLAEKTRFKTDPDRTFSIQNAIVSTCAGVPRGRGRPGHTVAEMPHAHA
ncbi:MAG: hypothetical protein EA405_08515 [Rhodospirillales bacterium]|nr:MAG: hypothetical protein EA405_08515 [Rhodospirillales bacterium]